MIAAGERPPKKLAGLNGLQGFTLLELLLVMAMVGLMACVATWGGRAIARGWQVKRAGHQLLEDLKAVQGRAEMSGSMSINNGSLVMQRTFLVFDVDARSYLAYAWQDRDSDGIAEADEASLLWQKSLPPGVAFGWQGDLDRRACSNVASPPTSPVSFARPAYAPCDGRPCVKFDQHGFSSMGPGAVYLHQGEQILAITATRPGHFTLCGWDGERWR